MDNSDFLIFVEDVRKWWINLNILVGEIKSREKRPILVALSRKMPRLMNWILGTPHLKESITPNLISDEEIITELALPFLHSHTGGDDVEFVILDDIIIHGTSLRTVHQNICRLFDSKVHVACIFRHERANINDFVNPSDLSRIVSIPQASVDIYTGLMADIVGQYQLPIDMEFPIFRIGGSLREIEDMVDLSGLVHKFYSNDECVTYDFSSGPMVSNNVDFSKARFFGKDGFSLLEVFSPLVISETDLLSMEKGLFGDTLYTPLWERLTRNIRLELNPDYKESVVQFMTQLRESYIRSLMVIANYLFSLAAFAMNIDILLPPGLKDGIMLSKEDLSLLIGRNLAREVYQPMLAAVKAEESAVSPREMYLDVPSSFAPDAFETEMDGERFHAAIVAETPSDAFDRIFRFQHYTNPKFENPFIAYERLFFGETHESLSEFTSLFFDSEECHRELQIWIDANIDAGYIVPNYERVMSENGEIFWRRFFHAGIRKKTDMLPV